MYLLLIIIGILILLGHQKISEVLYKGKFIRVFFTELGIKWWIISLGILLTGMGSFGIYMDQFLAKMEALDLPSTYSGIEIRENSGMTIEKSELNRYLSGKTASTQSELEELPCNKISQVSVLTGGVILMEKISPSEIKNKDGTISYACKTPESDDYNMEYYLDINGKIFAPNKGYILDAKIFSDDIIAIQIENTGGETWLLYSISSKNELGILNSYPTEISGKEHIITCTLGQEFSYGIGVFDVTKKVFDVQWHNPYRNYPSGWDIESQLMRENIVLNSNCKENNGILSFEAIKCKKAYWNKELGQRYFCENPGTKYSMKYDLKSKKLFQDGVEVMRKIDFVHE